MDETNNSRISEGSGAEIDLADLFRAIWHDRFIVIATTFLCCGLMLGLSLATDKTYRAETVLADATPRETAGRGAGSELFSAIAGLSASGGGASQVDIAIAILESRNFLEEFIEQVNLRPVLFPKAWDKEKGKWASAAQEDIPTKWAAYKLFESSILGVYKDPGTGLITLYIEWVDADLAASWANELVKRVNARMRAREIARSNQHIAYLREKLAVENVADLRVSISGLMAIEMQSNMLASSRDEFVFRVIDPARAPGRHFKPRVLLYGLLGLIIGSLASLLVVFFRSRSAGNSSRISD